MTIFVSYSREDSALVDLLTEDLEQAGLEVWRDRAIHGGTDWWDEILDQIRRCGVFVLAASRDSFASEACISEAKYASSLGCRILPVFLGEEISPNRYPSDLQQMLESTQYLLYRTGARSDGLRLAGTMHVMLQEARPPLPDPLPSPPPPPGAELTEIRQLVNRRDDLTPAEQGDLVKRIAQLGDAERERDSARELLQILAARDEITDRAKKESERVAGSWAAPTATGVAEPAEVVAESTGLPQSVVYRLLTEDIGTWRAVGPRLSRPWSTDISAAGRGGRLRPKVEPGGPEGKAASIVVENLEPPSTITWTCRLFPTVRTRYELKIERVPGDRSVLRVLKGERTGPLGESLQRIRPGWLLKLDRLAFPGSEATSDEADEALVGEREYWRAFIRDLSKAKSTEHAPGAPD